MSVVESGKPLGASIAALRQFFTSSIGAKVVMAVTGVIAWGFTIGHVIGNLQVFLYAPEGGYLGQQLNEYAHLLKSTPALLWGTRVVVGASFVLHFTLGLKLKAQNRSARGSQYHAAQRHDRSTFSSRFMAASGIMLLVFVVFHLLHFTGGVILSEFYSFRDQAGLHDVYQMMRKSFGVPWVAAFYVVSVTMLLLHLFHGSVSFWQSLGLRHPRWTPLLRVASRGVVFAIVAGYVAIPLTLFYWSTAS